MYRLLGCRELATAHGYAAHLMVESGDACTTRTVYVSKQEVAEAGDSLETTIAGKAADIERELAHS